MTLLLRYDVLLCTDMLLLFIHFATLMCAGVMHSSNELHRNTTRVFPHTSDDSQISTFNCTLDRGSIYCAKEKKGNNETNDEEGNTIHAYLDGVCEQSFQF